MFLTQILKDPSEDFSIYRTNSDEKCRSHRKHALFHLEEGRRSRLQTPMESGSEEPSDRNRYLK
ncbi:MAG: hypothetical protein B1H40_04510 [Candidatus Latescibacteria bacterium 4484_181]|nr:MAG: hypothetical protein B1H40_04510 [Candidatus Latescibacteria bacterium 4484_181]